MSKRKNRKSSSPNIPQATLDRARQQISGETPVKTADEPVEETVVEAKAAPAAPVAPPKAAAPRPSTTHSRSSSSRRRVEPAQARGGRKDQLDTEIVKNRLLHPTRTVSQEQLREEYGYVINDLRTIAIIAVVMIVFMVILAQII